MTRSRRRLSSDALKISVALLLICGLSRSGWAQDAAAYQEAVSAGYENFEAADYTAARADFERAYKIFAKPILLFNIASTYRRQGSDKLAIDYYRRYLDVAPPRASQRRQAGRVVKKLERELAKAEETPRAASQKVPDANGESEQATQEPADARRGRRITYIGVGLGVTGLASIGYGLWGVESGKETAFMVAGIGAVIAGGVLVAFGVRRRRSPDQAVVLAPYLSDSQGGIVVSGRF